MCLLNLELQEACVTWIFKVNTQINHTVYISISTDNEDFIPLETTVEFLPGETMKNVTISIIDDNVREGTEIFVVLLSNPSSGLSLGSPSALSVTINDLFIEFNQTAYNLTEGKNATLTVMLIGDTVDSLENVFTTRVDLITVNGTATGIQKVSSSL